MRDIQNVKRGRRFRRVGNKMGVFSKFKEKLTKTKDNFSKKLFEIFNRKVINDDFFDELEFALISADIGAETSADIIEELRESVLDKRIRTADEIKEELKEILIGRIDYDIPPVTSPAVIMVSGVNGAGKTTTVGKLAKKFSDSGKSVVLAAADTFRAAAAEQLEIWAERAKVRIVKHGEGADPAAVVYDAIASAKAKHTDIILVDTAGRLQTKKNLMDELSKITRVIKREFPEADYRNYIVIDATVGQNALSQVEAFNEAVDIDGIILTKLDGTAKGGVVIAVSAELDVPVLYTGLGEGVDDLVEFDAREFVNAIIE